MDTKKEINNFIIVAENHIEIVDAIKSATNEDHYKKILYLSLTEMLCKAVYGNRFKKGHRNKVLNFIKDFCTWEHAQHVSLPQLVLFLKKECPNELLDLKNYTSELISTWSINSSPVDLSSDPHIEDLRTLWPGSIQINNKWMTLDYFRHDHLLYTLRNSFVHENRPPGISFSLEDKEKPYYIATITDAVDEDGKLHEELVGFELNHPVIFFKNLLLNALPQIKEYLLEQSINPYNNFTVSSAWI